MALLEVSGRANTDASAPPSCDTPCLPCDAAGIKDNIDRRFVDLVRSHEKRLLRFVQRNIGNPSDAEDIAQQAFVDAYRSMKTFRGESELSTWLYGIAMNLVRNYLNRAPHRVRKYESDDVLENHPSEADEPDENVARAELLNRLVEQVDQLPPGLKQVFMFVAIDGLSYNEAALRFEIPVGTVRSRLFHARNVVKNRMPDLHALLKS